jgi:outer membrane protein assembly factor BamB
MDKRISTRMRTGAIGVALLAATVHCGTSGTESSPSGTYPPLPSSPSAWSEPLGGTAVSPASVAVAHDGSVRVAGELSGLATIGASVLRPAGATDVLIASLRSSGDVIWAHDYGDASEQSATAVAVDAAGDTIVVGTFAGTLDFSSSQAVIQSGTFPVSAAPTASPALHARGGTDAFVAKLDASGNQIWSTQIGVVGTTTTAESVTVGSDGRIVVTGTRQGAPVVEGTSAPPGYASTFVTALDALGGAMWTVNVGADKAARSSAIALGAEDAVLVGSAQEAGIMVEELDADGAVVWTHVLGDASDSPFVRVAFDASGDGLVLADYGGMVTTGFGPARTLGVQMHVLKYTPAGAVLWEHAFGSIGGAITGNALAVDDSGDVYVAGQLGEPLVFGQCSLDPGANPTAGATPAFLGRLEPDGTATCATAYGVDASVQIDGLAIAAPLTVVMTGTFAGPVDFGQGSLRDSMPLRPESGPSGFIAQEPAALEVTQ